MSKSRFGTSPKYREAAMRAFAVDLEEHPEAVAGGARAIVEGHYGTGAVGAIRSAARSPRAEARIAILVGLHRYRLGGGEAVATWTRLPLGAQRRVEAALRPVADLVRALGDAPTGPAPHAKGRWRSARTFEGRISGAYLGAPKRSGRPSAPSGTTAVDHGVYRRSGKKS